MKTEEEFSPSPRILNEVRNLIEGSVPIESIKGYWDAVKFLAMSEFSRESDYAGTFWKDFHAIGKIIITMQEEQHDRLRKYASDRSMLRSDPETP